MFFLIRYSLSPGAQFGQSSPDQGAECWVQRLWINNELQVPPVQKIALIQTSIFKMEFGEGQSPGQVIGGNINSDRATEIRVSPVKYVEGDARQVSG